MGHHWAYTIYIYICIKWELYKKRRRDRATNIIWKKKITAYNFSNVMKNINLLVQEPQQISNKLKEIHIHHIIVKLTKLQDKTILKVRKTRIMYRNLQSYQQVTFHRSQKANGWQIQSELKTNKQTNKTKKSTKDSVFSKTLFQ